MITGKQVRLRAIERSDLPRFVSWLNDPEVTRGLMMYLPLSMAQEENWFENLLKRPMDEHPLAIEVLHGSEWRMVGNCAFHNIEWRVRQAEIGIMIGDKTCWNQGIGRQAMTLMVQHAFHNLNLNRVWLRVYATNERAIRSYERVGFQHEGRWRQAAVQEGSLVDVILMGILRDEWQAPQI